MKILAIDTATEACSAALHIDGEVVELFQIAPRQHSELILPMLDKLMNEARLQPQQLDVLAFACGPGSFTGVRIAASIIQGIALGADLPVAAVSTLATLAQQCFEDTDTQNAFAAIDARMNEVYWGIYQRNSENIATLLGCESVSPPSQIRQPNHKGMGVGSGWRCYQAELLLRCQTWVDGYQENALPKASTIAKLGKEMANCNLLVPAEKAVPVYLRNNVAKTT